MTVEKQDASPQVDGLLITPREVFVEPAEKQLLDPLVTLGATQCFGGQELGTQRIHMQVAQIIALKKKAETFSRPGFLPLVSVPGNSTFNVRTFS